MRLTRIALCFLVTLALLTAASAAAQSAPSQAGNASSASTSTRWASARIDRSTIGDGDDRGQYASVATKGGTTFVSYYDATNHELRAARTPYPAGGNCGPNNRWYCETVDSTAGDVGQYSSIAPLPVTLLYGPGIAYYETDGGGGGALKFAEYTCQFVPCFWSTSTIDSSASAHVGQYASFKYDMMGARHIAYRSVGATSSVLLYAHSVSNGGNCGGGKWKCETIDTIPDIEEGFASLDLNSSNQPRIAYYDSGNHDLKYAVYLGTGTGTCGPSNNWWCGRVDNVTDAGAFVSMQVDRATTTAHIAYYDGTLGKLKYAHWVGGSGNCGDPFGGQIVWQCDAIDDMGYNLSQAGISLALDANGWPHIVYQDATETQAPAVLKIARPSIALGQASGNCGPTNNWQCDVLDMGESSINEGDYASITFNSAGLATVAYYESDTFFYHTGYLKVLQQMLQLQLPLIRK